MLKHLQKLLLLAALCVPWVTQAQTTCQIKIVGEDGYGDGWNDGYLTVTQGTTTIGTFSGQNFPEDSDGPELDSVLYTVNSGTPVTFSWTSGDYDDEVTIWIYDGGGSLLFSVNEPSAGTIFTMNTPCPSCMPPTGLAATVTGSDIDFTWNAGTESSWQIVWGTVPFNPDTVTVNIDYVTTPSYSLTNMPDGQYRAYVRTDCGVDSSNWASVNFNLGVIIMNMATSGTATINTCNATIYDDGGPTGQYSGYCNSYLNIYPADADHILKLWGYSNTESSFDYLRITDLLTGDILFLDNATPNGRNIDTIIVFGGVELYFHSDGSVYYDGFDVHIECLDAPTCMPVAGVALDHATPDSLVITWIDTINSGASYIVKYRPHNSTGDWDSVIVTGTTAYLDQLTPNTLYDIIVRSDCGGEYGFDINRSYRTLCSYITQLPYSNDFEDDPHYSVVTYAEAFPSCWTRINDASGTYNYYPYLTTTANYVHSGSVAMYWYHTTTTTYANNEYAIMPPIDLDVYDMSDLTLSFYAKTTSTSYHPAPIIGVMSNTDDTSTFEPVYAFSSTEITTDWQLFVIPLSSYTGNGNMIAIKWPRPGSSWYMAIDDIFITDEWCDVPHNVVAMPATDEITISWEPNGGSSFTVILGQDTVTGVTDTFYTFTNLTPNTPFEYAVSTECSNGNSMYIGGEIRTTCVVLDSLPYSYGFEDLATGSSSIRPEIPCWQHLNNGSSYFGYPYASSTSPHSGTRNMYWYMTTTTGTYGDYAILVLPGVDTNLYPINTLRLTFWARSSSTSYNPVFQVGVMTNPYDASTFQPYDTITVGGNTTYSKFTTIFGQFTGEGQYVAVRAVRPPSSWYAYTDDFTLDLAPNCAPIESYQVQTTVGAALINWTVDPNFANVPESFEVSYSYLADSLVGATTFTQNDMTLTLTGLTADTSYMMSITPSCDGESGIPYIFTFNTKVLPCIEWDTTSGSGASSPEAVYVVGTPGSSSTNVMPVNGGYNYSYCNHLITRAEIPEVPTGTTYFSGIDFQYAGSAPMTAKSNCALYMCHTTMTTCTDFANPADLVLVYEGPLNCTDQGWNHFEFNRGTFAYDGTSNIIVAIVDNSGAYNSGDNFYYQSGSNSMSHRVYRNDSPYTYADLGTVTASNSMWRSNMRLTTGGGGECLTQASCAAPAVMMQVDTNNDLNLTWIPGYQETSWNIEYRPANDANWTMAATGVSNTNYTLSTMGWLANTQYEIRVSAVCTDTTIGAVVNYKTPCGAMALPFSENFDTWSSSTSDPLPDCWLKRTNYSTNYPYASTSYYHSGTKSMYMYSTSTTWSYMVLPQFDAPIDSLLVSFWLYKSNTSYAHNLKVGVMTDPEDESTFVQVAEVSPSALSTWELFEVPLSSYTGNGQYIAFMSPNGEYSYPYLDDLEVTIISGCGRVYALTASTILLDNATIVWSDSANTSWYVEYGTEEFTPGTGYMTPILVTDTTYTLTGLDSGTVYHVYVYPDCNGTVSERHLTFSTLAASPATVPYSCDFEAEGVNGWDLIQAGQNNYWIVDSVVNNGGSQSMYITNDGISHNYSGTTSVSFASRVFNLQAGNYFCSYDWMANGESSFDFIRVALVPANVELQAGNYSGFDNASAMPSGSIGLDGNNRMNLQSSWTTHTEEFTLTQSGTYRLVFMWRNDGSVYNQPPAAIDNVVLRLNTCPIVSNLQATAADLSSITIDWTEVGSATQWEVEYTDGTVTNNMFTTTHPLTINGLVSSTNYVVRVRPICSATDTGAWCGAINVATSCDIMQLPYVENFDTYTGTTYSTEGVLPNCWDFFSNGTSNAYKPHITGSGSYWYPHSNPNALTMTSGSSSYGDTKIVVLPEFESPVNTLSMTFWYKMESATNGSMLTVGYVTGMDYQNTFVPIDTVTSTTTITYDSISFENVPDSATRVAFKWYYNTSFYSCGIDDITVTSTAPACRVPSGLIANNITYNEATVSWTGNAADYEIAVMAATDATYPEPTLVSNAASYTFTGLAPATMYRYHVRAICDEAEGLISDWAEGTFTTDSLPCFDPSELAVQTTGYTTVTLGWTANGEETNWRIHVWNTAFDTTYDVNTNPATVGGLAPDVDYSAEVMALCGAVMLESGVSNTVTFHTAMCEVPTGVTVNNVTAHTAVVSWTGTAQSYRVTYGYEGFGTGNEIAAIPVTGTTTTLTGLESGETYDVYVYAVCETGIESNASTKQTFETDIEGISTADGMNVSIYPNPTTDATTIALSGVNGEVSITIVDMNGRIVKSDSMSCEGDCTKRMEVNGLAQGAYFVRINGEGLNMVKKLVVK